MTQLLTAAQMRAIEQAAIDSGEVTGLELMERAGQGVVEAIFEQWPELAGAAPVAGAERVTRPSHSPEYFQEDKGKGGFARRAVVLCGPGNNGGDGFVVARLLAERGWAVEVVEYGDHSRLGPDAAANCARWDGPRVAFQDWDVQGAGWGCDLLVDALFGVGVSRSARDLGALYWDMESMVERADISFDHPRGRPAIVAIDLPSGVCSDSGRAFPHADDHNRFHAAAHLTVTFHAPKLGHYLGQGARAAGNLVVKGIGLSERDDHVLRRSNPPRAMLAHGKSAYLLNKVEDDHKYHHGHALILSGPLGRSGAARLAARGALRVGAGLVTVAAPQSAMAECAAQLTAIMLREIEDARSLETLLQDGRLNALCLGPGLGLERARAMVPVALASERALVLDADALTAFADTPEALFEMLHPNVVLTPHEGEFDRLFPDIHAKWKAPAKRGPAYSKVDAVRAATARAGCTLLLKGPDTVIADPQGHAAINASVYERAAPWLATAGSGDVLAGLITGLLARGLEPKPAAETGAWLHTEAARKFGPGLIAEDLPEQVPNVLADLV